MAEKESKETPKVKAAPKKKAAPKTEVKSKETKSAAKAKAEAKDAASVKSEGVAKISEKAGAVAEKKTSAVKKKSSAETVAITLKRSAIGRPKDQKAALVGMGFKRLHQTVVLKDTPETRGMIRKVSHLVTVA